MELALPFQLSPAADLREAKAGPLELSQAGPVIPDRRAQPALDQELLRAAGGLAALLGAPALPGFERLAPLPERVDPGIPAV